MEGSVVRSVECSVEGSVEGSVQCSRVKWTSDRYFSLMMSDANFPGPMVEFCFLEKYFWGCLMFDTNFPGLVVDIFFEKYF